MPRPSIPVAVALVCVALLSSSLAVAQADLDALFAPPTPAEIAAVAADWAARDVTPTAYAVEQSAAAAGFDLQEVRHEIDGLVHYGVVRYPHQYQATGKFPVLVLLHGGFDGLDLNWMLTFDETYPAGCFADSFLVVAPTFRGEMLNGYDILPTRFSGGETSYFDHDCDDAIALLTAVLDNVPAADHSRVVVLGGSRGGNVAYRMALRDPRVKRTAIRYGPTDFRLPHVQAGAQEWLDTGVTDDPLGAKVGEYIAGPYLSGAITLEKARHLLTAWSVVPHLTAGLWLQVHHGELDQTVPIAHSEAVAARMTALGAGEPSFEFYVYPQGSHTPTSLDGHEALVEAFLCTLPATTAVATLPSPLRLGVAPNPFAGAVELFTLGDGAKALTGPLTVRILDARGRLVRTMSLEPGAGARAAAAWDGRDASGRNVPSGVYFAAPQGAVSAPTRMLRLK